MLMIQLNCPHCQRRFAVLGTLATTETICPGCTRTILVPIQSEPPPTSTADREFEQDVSETGTSAKTVPIIIVAFLGVLLLAAALAWYKTQLEGQLSGTDTAHVAPTTVDPLHGEPKTSTTFFDTTQVITSTNTIRVGTDLVSPSAHPNPTTASKTGSASAPYTEGDSPFLAAARSVAYRLDKEYPWAKNGETIVLKLIIKKEIVGTLKKTDTDHVYITNELGNVTRVSFTSLDRKSRLTVDRAFRKHTIKMLARKAISS